MLTYITGDEKIQFIRVFRSALLIYQYDVLVFQNKILHLPFACTESYMEVTVHSLQKSLLK